jgi:uncharacterized protein YndB with AHSA1/START domain
MPTDTIEIARIIPATPERIFQAWLDAAEHAAMTGSPATVESLEVGGRFTAWDGYIDGSHLALEPGVRIVQSWRSDDFPVDALDSRLEVRLEAAPGGTRVTLRHSDLPEGQGPALLEGWDEFYLEPMAHYFARSLAKGAGGGRGGTVKKKAPARKAAAKAKAAPARRATAKRMGAKPAGPRRAAKQPARKVVRKVGRAKAKKRR